MHTPGWYPDPYAPAGLRWWDGAAWTAHQAPPPPPVAMYGVLPPDPVGDLARENKWAGRASIAIIWSGVVQAVNNLLGGIVFARVWHHVVHQLSTIDSNPNTQANLDLGPVWALDLVGLLAIVPQVFVLVWLFQSAGVARNLQLPARRSQIWAILGFLVPIVNFWFPYQVAADLFPPASPHRRLAGQWWGWYLGQIAVGLAVLGSAFASTTAAMIVALAGAFVPFQMVRYGRHMIAAATAAHHELIGQRL